MKNHLLFLLLLLIVACSGIERAVAQTTQASILSVISDYQKIALPAATIQVRNESTGFTTGTVTNVQGEYSFEELPLGGPYILTISFIGFGNQKRTSYLPNQGDAIRVNLSL